MNRRQLLHAATANTLAALSPLAAAESADPGATAASGFRRVRPGDAGWPSQADWAQLGEQVAGRVIEVESPWDAARRDAPDGPACRDLLRSLKNPYANRDAVALTQSLGWTGAWTSMPSAFAVVARTTADVVAAVDFARNHRLRIVVKGGGHSYQGTSNAADSLLVWTRQMNAIRLEDGFVASGCAGRVAPQRAVSIGAGAIWAEAYDAVTTQGGGYVQGGGCMTVGVAGLIQSGGFGNFSKAYGLAAASLLEAEVVTADGAVRLANACTHPELFWGLKGGGGGSLGIVTRVTLKVHPLHERFGAVNLRIRARSPEAFRRLVGSTLDLCRSRLMNPHWGEQIRMRPDNLLQIMMVFQGLTRGEANDVWQPFLDAVTAAPGDFRFESPPLVVSTSAREFWAPSRVKRALGFMAVDDRPGAPQANVFWPGDQGQAGQVIHGYGSTWLPKALLDDDRPGAAGREALADALFAASRHWGFSLHLNKGLAGAPAEVIAASRDTAMNPAVLGAFALLIMGSEEQPAYPGLAGHEPDIGAARRHAGAIDRAMAVLQRLVPDGGAYVSESNYFDAHWATSFWGPHYPRLQAVKARYDPDGLFFVHHGVGSERWSDDGFTALAAASPTAPAAR